MAVRPTIIRDEDTLVALLRGRRQELGISQQALDCRIGWADGYAAKAEAPSRAGKYGCRGYGRRVIWGLSNMLAYWLESLGLALVVMDKAQAEALVANSEGVDIAGSTHNPYPGRTRRREIVHTHVLRSAIVFPARVA